MWGTNAFYNCGMVAEVASCEKKMGGAYMQPLGHRDTIKQVQLLPWDDGTFKDFWGHYLTVPNYYNGSRKSQSWQEIQWLE